MARNTRFYLGRVMKLGEIDEPKVEAAILEPVNVRRGDFEYTFTDIEIVKDATRTRYIYAKLAKYTPKGSVEVVEPDEHVAKAADVANLQVASSAFIYLPQFSGIAYQHVWNKLGKDLFEKVFADLVTEKYQGFFAKTSVEPISDLRSFVKKVMGMEHITKIQATVRPPNPLFGPAWKSLREYIKQRNVGELKVEERAADRTGVATSIPALAEASSKDGGLTEEDVISLMASAQGGIADPAVLMAADGYGVATVEGEQARRRVVVKTADSQVHFLTEGEPGPEDLYERARDILVKINDDRYLEHP